MNLKSQKSVLRASQDASRGASGDAIPCVIYAAKSSEDVRESIPEQLLECRRAAAEDGARPVAEYTDEAFSAFRGNRGPGLEAAMRHAEALARAHGGAELWAQHSDRLARGDGRVARHAVEIALWGLKRNVRIRTLQDPDTFRDLLYAVVTGQRNHEDSRRRGLAVAAGKRRAAERGDYLGYQPDGYRIHAEITASGGVARSLEIDPERKPVIELIFAMALRGERRPAIARGLNRAGWQTKPPFPARRATAWTTARVTKLLENPRYAGLSVSRGEIVARGCWPTYISEAQHNRIVAWIAETKRVQRPQARRESYLLAKAATCGHCGRPLYVRTQQERGDGTFDRRYMCASAERSNLGARCEAPTISAEMLESMFVASLATLLEGATEPQASERLVGINSRERRHLTEALRHSDQREIDLALERIMARRSREVRLSTRAGEPGEALSAFYSWALEEQIGRSETTRRQARALNRKLREWFTSITVTADPQNITIQTARPTAAGVSHGRVDIDVQGWMRVRPEAKWLRRRHRRWSQAEILGALQSWADANGRPPMRQDWDFAAREHPARRTVTSHFGSWQCALEQAGLGASAG